jgi:hypothetical protein
LQRGPPSSPTRPRVSPSGLACKGAGEEDPRPGAAHRQEGSRDRPPKKLPRAGEVKRMTLGERIDLAREALAQGLAPLPIVLSALEIPRATWYYYRKQKVGQAKPSLGRTGRGFRGEAPSLGKRSAASRGPLVSAEGATLQRSCWSTPSTGIGGLLRSSTSARRAKLVEGNPRQPQAGPPPASGLPPLPEAHRPETQAQSLAGDCAFGRGQGGPEGLASQAKGTGTL